MRLRDIFEDAIYFYVECRGGWFPETGLVKVVMTNRRTVEVLFNNYVRLTKPQYLYQTQLEAKLAVDKALLKLMKLDMKWYISDVKKHLKIFKGSYKGLYAHYDG